MRWRTLYFMCVALCCLHVASEPLRLAEDYKPRDRRRRSEGNDGLALSREIFRNITKQLRENIKKEAPADKNDRLHQSKTDDGRHFGPYQPYHHHEHHWGPYFEGDIGEGAEGTTQVTSHVGSEALLNCRVGMLKDKTVMWLRRNADSAQLLTVGPAPYAGDNRVAVKFQYPNNWRLSVDPVKKADAGLYMCQISTHPPRAILANLTVLPPIITINGDESHDMKDRFYKSGSSINLACIISEEFINSIPKKYPTTTPIPLTTSTPSTTTTELTTKTSTVLNRIDLVMNKSWSVETTTITSTVSISTTTKKMPKLVSTTEMYVETTRSPIVNNVFGLMWKKQGKEMVEGITWRNFSATFNVASATQNDSGTYSCHLQNHSQVIVNVHVLIAGENQAAVHHDTWNNGNLFWKSHNLFPIFILSFSIIFT